MVLAYILKLDIKVAHIDVKVYKIDEPIFEISKMGLANF